MLSEPIGPKVTSEADEWFTPGRFAALLGLLIFAGFPEVVTLQATFFHRDFALFGYPLAYYHRQSFWQGQVPLWTPLSFCGLPFLAQWNTMTLYPLSLFYLLLPLSWSLGLFCLGHLLLGGVGMYFLAHRWTGNRFAASVSGVAFAFNALMLNCLMWPNNIAGFGWMPWVVLTVERGWREGGRPLLVAALVGAMQMLSGAPEVILLTWLLMGAMLLFRAPVWPVRWKEAGRFSLIAVLVGLLAAVQLLPFLDLLLHSQRSTSFGDSKWAMPIWGWANFLVPLFRAEPTQLGVYFQPDQYWVYSYYLGIGSVTLALLVPLSGMRQPRTRLLAVMTLVCLILALGDRGFLYAGLRRVLPGIGFLRYPVKFIILPALVLPLLAGVYVGYYRGLSAVEWPRQRRRIIWLGGLLSVVVLGLAWLGVHYRVRTVASIVPLGSGLSRIVFLLALLASLLLLPRVQRPRLQWLLRLGILALLWLDVMTMGPRPNPVVKREAYEPGLIRRELHMSALPRVGESRATLRDDTENGLYYMQFPDALETVLYARLALFTDVNLLDDIPKVIGFYSLFSGHIGNVLRVLYSTPTPPSGLADFLAISQINLPGRATEWTNRPSHLTWITGGQRPVFADAATVLHALGQPDFDPRETVFLPPDCRSYVTVTNASEPRIVLREFTALRARAEVEAASPALVVISQSFYHDWRAYVDGQAVRLLRANHAFQAVEVPAGHHELRLVYEDRMFRWGAVASALTLAACGVLLIRRSKKPSANDG